MKRQRYRYTDRASVLVDFTLSQPGRQWLAGLSKVGGLEFTSNRVASSYVVRDDLTMRQRIRYTEAEQAAVFKMIDHAMEGVLIDVFPDATAGLFRPCYLLEPRMRPDGSEPMQGQPADYPGDLERDLLWVDDSDVGWAAVKFYD